MVALRGSSQRFAAEVRVTIPDRNAAGAPICWTRLHGCADTVRVRLQVLPDRLPLASDLGWHAAATKTILLATTALRMAPWLRDSTGHAVKDGRVHHSGDGSQFMSVPVARKPAPERIATSLGSIGDAYDSTDAQAAIGLFKNESIRDSSPFQTATADDR